MKLKQALFYTALFVFLILNIISSQSVSTLFFDLVKGKKGASVDFLKKISKESYFNRFYSEASNSYSGNLEDAVYSDTLDRQQKIKLLEQVLQTNPKSRDALYNLYLLHLKEGEDDSAQYYLEQAQAIDPEVKP